MTLIDDARVRADESDLRDASGPSRQHLRAAAAHAAAWTAGTLAWSFLCVYVLNTSTFIGKADSAYITTNSVPLAGLVAKGNAASVLFVWMILVGLRALTGRTWIALAVSLNLSLVLAALNAAKLRFRAEPISPSDVQFLSSPRFLASMVPVSWFVLAAVGLMAVTWLIYLVARRSSRPAPRAPALRRGVARLVVVLVCGALVVSAGGFNQPGNVVRRVFDSDVHRWAHWSQHENFQKNGFVPGILYGMPVDAMAAPADYSADRMAQIVERYQADAAAINADRDPTALDELNIVVVLSESFSDPTRLDGMSINYDPIPITRRVMEHTTSGDLLVGGYGGGTANVEFEVLTGMTLGFFAPQMATPYQQLFNEDETFPSLVRWFGERGHDTLAVHPFSGEMYQRREVYPQLGFGAFVEESDLPPSNARRTGEYVGDAAAFDEVLDQLRTHDRPAFAQLVTMQNHMPYDRHAFDKSLPVEGLDAEFRETFGQYARGIQLSDVAMGDFLGDLAQFHERTVVVFYGDHLPGLYPGEVSAVNGRKMLETPFFIWKNFGDNEPDPQPVTSSSQLLPLMYDAVDAPVPPYVALLERVRAHVPAVQRGIMLDSEGQLVHESGLDADARRALEDYRLVQYDLAVGNRWSEDALFGEAP